ncbi:GAF domain-containing protein [Mucilaginibacter sp. Bleaf8]|uniref:GAF domain-containing protein n=1 Tax=Mucilaginibacter sp. Bleaf8 TaxID=2834430 RepID=UPI001BD0E743|nr:GAF domain-containing protein [Mucilaginibacter sp. Bleaf8]MBS7563000.1 GAF domain-containing protein [Mucilaginibacter sp. Bleaf8]
MSKEESSRLNAVNRFLGIRINKQSELQAISQLAADICGTPRGLITLIDQDTEYVLSENTFTRSSSRADSFCHYVLESDVVMIVPDAQADQRLKDYPAVTGKSGIRFYAGTPITTHDGHRLGSLCVIDQRPGELTALQQDMLQNLATQVIQLLEFESNLHFLKSQFLEAKQRELKMRSFFESTASSYILIDRNFKVVAFNKAVQLFIRRAYQVDIQAGMDITRFINETYMAEFLKNCALVLAGETIRKERLLNFGGQSVWCMLTYSPARNAAGEIIGISYNSSDVTERVARQQAAMQQQVQLDRIAYMQSHEFRRPVATIKGLLNLLEINGHHTTFPVLSEIQLAIDEIDEKICKIVTIADPNILCNGPDKAQDVVTAE